MKVKDLIKKLCDYNMESEVYIEVSNTEQLAWYSSCHVEVTQTDYDHEECGIVNISIDTTWNRWEI